MFHMKKDGIITQSENQKISATTTPGVEPGTSCSVGIRAIHCATRPRRDLKVQRALISNRIPKCNAFGASKWYVSRRETHATTPHLLFHMCGFSAGKKEQSKRGWQSTLLLCQKLMVCVLSILTFWKPSSTTRRVPCLSRIRLLSAED